ncbi:DUF1972 domain-containing protein [Paraburkholderia phosphatilytica]|uniref:DUF1972 domain-containing protein n=1 Tax=Paraburkholderia phosphatilytica TaxID=2282883 RepID=UPI000E528F2E|nr:DUF1972 domain-containing protein [Paraburkholderia phosphatilytica]
MNTINSVAILGTRGIPARHGGFETFAERLALYLTQRGWKVTVYCQGDPSVSRRIEDTWAGIHRITLPVKRSGAAGTIEFDWACVRDVVRMRPGVALTLGYNTAIFCVWMRLLGVRNLINMDGLEWRRDKWRKHERAWLWANERIGCWTGEHLIADHPAIADHLATRVSRRKISTIAYGADRVDNASTEPLDRYALRADNYGIVIGRPEPENSILEIVRAFSQKRRGAKLVVLGDYRPNERGFHREVVESASDEVVFPGAIYDPETVKSLRFHARFYVHGHRVGGTNPSLVEALGAGSAIIAHDNRFNRWVAGAGGRYFESQAQCDRHIGELLRDDQAVAQMRANSAQRFADRFRWSSILEQYESLLERYVQSDVTASSPTGATLKR